VLAVFLFTACSFNHAISLLQTSFVKKNGEFTEAILLEGRGCSGTKFMQNVRGEINIKPKRNLY
jgi:hypothetical protein